MNSTIVEELSFLLFMDEDESGKTFLVKEVLGFRMTFYHTGLSPVDDEANKTSLKDQLLSYITSGCNVGKWDWSSYFG